jgi:hypothetical protein
MHFKKALYLIILILYSTHGFSQLRAGIKGGLNMSSFDTEGLNLREFTSGYHYGLFARLNLTDYFGIQPELLYNTKGRAGEVLRFELGYVDIPLLAVINFTPNFNIQLGPYASYLTEGRVISGSNGNTQILPNFDRNTYRSLDYGLIAGAAVESRRFTLGLRYNYGLNEVFRDIDLINQIHNLGATARNSVWQLHLGIFII